MVDSFKGCAWGVQDSLRRSMSNKGILMYKTIAAVLATGIALAVPAQADEVSLEPEAIAALFPGHYEARVAGGYKLMIAAREDGSMMGRAFGREDRASGSSRTTGCAWRGAHGPAASSSAAPLPSMATGSLPPANEATRP
jgi:hypothetical protein